MKTKLVSLNAGITMIVRRGKQEQTIGFTGVLPSKRFQSVDELLNGLCDFLNREFEADFVVVEANAEPTPIHILKPKRISRPVVDTEKIIKELVT